MELKKRSAKSWHSRDGFAAPTYDSTKANFDELEKGWKELDELWDLNHARVADHAKRLTALESKISDHVNNIWHGPYKDAELAHRLTTLEAKDAPKTYVLRQGGKVVRTFVDDPNTCGNCGLAARFDNNEDVVICWCDSEDNTYQLRMSDHKACPHHERRA